MYARERLDGSAQTKGFSLRCAPSKSPIPGTALLVSVAIGCSGSLLFYLKTVHIEELSNRAVVICDPHMDSRRGPSSDGLFDPLPLSRGEDLQIPKLYRAVVPNR